MKTMPVDECKNNENNACRAVMRALTTKCQYRKSLVLLAKAVTTKGGNNEKGPLVRVLMGPDEPLHV